MDDDIQVIARCLERLTAGDSTARAALLQFAYARLRVVVEKRLDHFARLARWEQADDVTQEAAVKLWGALNEISPRTVREFWGMAAEEVRRVLLDLTRHHFGPHQIAAYTETGLPIGAAPAERVDSNVGAANLERWTALHEQIAHLPEDERDITMALWYGGLTMSAAASVLGISPDIAQRRWKEARMLLSEALRGERPDG